MVSIIIYLLYILHTGLNKSSEKYRNMKILNIEILAELRRLSLQNEPRNKQTSNQMNMGLRARTCKWFPPLRSLTKGSCLILILYFLAKILIQYNITINWVISLKRRFKESTQKWLTLSNNTHILTFYIYYI